MKIKTINPDAIIRMNRPFFDLDNTDLSNIAIMANTEVSKVVLDEMCGDPKLSNKIYAGLRTDILHEISLRN